ncbi:MAG TPA: 8-oxo-dGTP diphosphatase [Actinocrinis sp.]
MTLAATCLCLLTRTGPSGEREVLLGLKKTGFGTGKIVGLGGHIERGESVAQAVVREVMEESGILVEPTDLRALGLIVFRFPNRPQWDMLVTVFVADRFSGKPDESDEVVPEWFGVDKLPYERMWSDARQWLPRILAGERVIADIVFAADNQTVAETRFSEA